MRRLNFMQRQTGPSKPQGFGALVAWFETTFRERTRLQFSGDGRVDWIDTGTRVAWSEVEAHAREVGLPTSPALLRVEFDRFRDWPAWMARVEARERRRS